MFREIYYPKFYNKILILKIIKPTTTGFNQTQPSPPLSSPPNLKTQIGKKKENKKPKKERKEMKNKNKVDLDLHLHPSIKTLLPNHSSIHHHKPKIHHHLNSIMHIHHRPPPPNRSISLSLAYLRLYHLDG